MGSRQCQIGISNLHYMLFKRSEAGGAGVKHTAPANFPTERNTFLMDLGLLPGVEQSYFTNKLNMRESETG